MLFCNLRLIFKPYCTGISPRKTKNQSASRINVDVHIFRKRQCYRQTAVKFMFYKSLFFSVSLKQICLNSGTVQHHIHWDDLTVFLAYLPLFRQTQATFLYRRCHLILLNYIFAERFTTIRPWITVKLISMCLAIVRRSSKELEGARRSSKELYLALYANDWVYFFFILSILQEFMPFSL